MTGTLPTNYEPAHIIHPIETSRLRQFRDVINDVRRDHTTGNVNFKKKACLYYPYKDIHHYPGQSRTK